jgi:hypothetical protein
VFVAALLAVLPMQLTPDAPFPRVLSSPRTVQRVTPGLEYAQYDLTTAMGPIVVRVLELAPNHPQIQLDAVLARDALTSNAETISSMAGRTHAIAGINGDYFDINATNQPTNVVVRSGTLLRTPRKRYALFMKKDGSSTIEEVAFTGQLQTSSGTFAIDAVNEMQPPHGGISLLTPEYGSVAPNDALTLISLQPANGTPPLTSYTVGNQADNFSRQPAGYYLAIGPAAIARTGVPNPGDTIVATGNLDPVDLQTLGAAVGGGPLILNDGKWYDDLDGPRGGTYSMRAPQSGAALKPDGTLLLVEVDGRQPDLSVGVTPPEFSALMRELGAVRGMEFDSGGSAEMSVRLPGNDTATLVNSPSDGKERPVSNGVFLYSTAPVTIAAQIVAQPQSIRAVTGASLDVTLATVDAAYHRVPAPGAVHADVVPSSLGTFAGGRFTARAAGSGTIEVKSGTIVARIPVEVLDAPARVSIFPNHPAVEKDGRIDLDARAYDAAGYALALPQHLAWQTTSGTIDPNGMLQAGSRDADVSLSIGGRTTQTRVAVGFRDMALPFSERAHFMTAPKGGSGNTAMPPDCAGCVELQYALGNGERAAYAVAEIPLPPRSAGLAFDLRDDGSGALVKIALHNALEEQVLLPATSLSGRGWRHIVVRFPQSLAQPAKLMAIYVIGSVAGDEHSGTIAIKNVKAVVAGSE